jgi:hypothetical protein
MVIESQIESVVLEGLFDLYEHDKLSTELRSSLVSVLSVQTMNLAETFRKLTVVTPFSSWLIAPSKLTYEGMETLGKTIDAFSTASLLNISHMFMDLLHLVIQPLPFELPVAVYAGIVVRAFESGQISPEMLIQEGFLEVFIFQVSPADIAASYPVNKSVLPLIGGVYSFSEDFRSFRSSFWRATTWRICRT